MPRIANLLDRLRRALLMAILYCAWTGSALFSWLKTNSLNIPHSGMLLIVIT